MAESATGGVKLVKRTVATAAGTRPYFMIEVIPGRGAHLETVWLGGGPGRDGTVGGYVRAKARAGAVGGMNGDFFLLAQKLPSSGLLLHRGHFFGNPQDSKGVAYFNPDGSLLAGPSKETYRQFAAAGAVAREGIGGKPVIVYHGLAQGPGALTAIQARSAYHRSAVGRLRNGDTALVVIGGSGVTYPVFARALVKLGFVEAIGFDIDSSADLDWQGASLNRPGFERSIPTGIIVYQRAARTGS